MKKPRLYYILALALTVTGLLAAARAVRFGAADDGIVTTADYVPRYLDLISKDSLREHVAYLASDALLGRYVGTPQIEDAAQYVTTRYERAGLISPEGVTNYLQSFTVYHERPRSVSFEVTSDSETKIRTVFALGRASDAIPVSADLPSGRFEVVFAGYGIDDDTLGYSDYEALGRDGIEVEGKWLLILADEPSNAEDASLLWRAGAEASAWTTGQLFHKRGAANRAGQVAGLLIVTDRRTGGSTFLQESLERSRQWEYAAAPMLLDPEPIPASMAKFVYVSSRFANALLSSSGFNVEELQHEIDDALSPKVAELPGVALEITAERDRPPVAAHNIVAVIEGSDPALKHEYVIVTSHLDHNGSNPLLKGDSVFNGAADDASGVAGTLELARVLGRARADGNGPRRSVLFLNTSAEERGVLGSTYFADRNPVVPLDHVIADVNLDGIGGFDADHPDGGYIYVITSDALGRPLIDVVKLAEEAADTGLSLETDKDFNSDHLSFAAHLVPYVYFSTGFVEHYHRVSDEAQTIDYEHLEAVSRLALATVWRLANDSTSTLDDRAALARRTGFKCPPCGVAPHDENLYDTPGYCPRCGMRLVPAQRGS